MLRFYVVQVLLIGRHRKRPGFHPRVSDLCGPFAEYLRQSVPHGEGALRRRLVSSRIVWQACFADQMWGPQTGGEFTVSSDSGRVILQMNSGALS